MSPSLKKICLYILADALGYTIELMNHSDTTTWRAKKLQEASKIAFKNIDFTIDNSKQRQAERKIAEVYTKGDKVDVLFGLLFLLAGLCDLDDHSPDNMYNCLLIRRTNWLIEIWDKKLDKTEKYKKAMQEYTKWTV